jgi:hypothetical protein
MQLPLTLTDHKPKTHVAATTVDVQAILLLNVEPDELNNDPTKEIIIEEMIDATKGLDLEVVIDLTIEILLEKEETLEKEADTQTPIIVIEEELVFAHPHPTIETLTTLAMKILLLLLLSQHQRNGNNS